MKNRQMRSPLSGITFRAAGQSLDERIQELSLTVVVRFFAAISSILCTSFLWWIELTHTQPNLILPTLLTMGMTAWAVFDFFTIRKKIQKSKLGRDGEREVAHHLNAIISDGYQIIHDIDSGKGNIDHVIVGPTGIYTVETKTLKKPPKENPTISYNELGIRIGSNQPDYDAIKQANAESYWVRSRLKELLQKDYDVHPIIVFPGWFIKEPENITSLPVWVLNPKQIPFLINRRPKRLSSEEIQLISKIILLSSHIRY